MFSCQCTQVSCLHQPDWLWTEPAKAQENKIWQKRTTSLPNPVPAAYSVCIEFQKQCVYRTYTVITNGIPLFLSPLVMYIPLHTKYLRSNPLRCLFFLTLGPSGRPLGKIFARPSSRSFASRRTQMTRGWMPCWRSLLGEPNGKWATRRGMKQSLSGGVEKQMEMYLIIIILDRFRT